MSLHHCPSCSALLMEGERCPCTMRKPGPNDDVAAERERLRAKVKRLDDLDREVAAAGTRMAARRKQLLVELPMLIVVSLLLAASTVLMRTRIGG